MSSIAQRLSSQDSLAKIKTSLARLPWHLAVPLAFLVVMFLFYPFRERFEFDRDEGVNLMKAMLVEKGYSLYEEVWSDQPPLFTLILAFVFRVFGLKVNVARLLVLGMASVLVWACFEFTRLGWRWIHALAAVIILLLVLNFLIFSVAVMIGLPALTFAMLSLLALAHWHRQRKDIWLILSAIALGLSILTKALTGFLAPIFLGGLLLAEYQRLGEVRPLKRLLHPALVWLAVFFGFSGVLGFLLVGPDTFAAPSLRAELRLNTILWQLIQPHLAAREADFFRIEFYTLAWNLKESRSILLLGALGGVYALLARKWVTFYLVAWMVTATLLLWPYSPMWWHQAFLVMIPAAMLAGIAVGEALLMAVSWISRAVALLEWARKLAIAPAVLSIVTLAVFAWTLAARVPMTIRQFNPSPTLWNPELKLHYSFRKFLWAMEEYAPDTRWVVTDVPIYAFREKLPVPPNLATFTSKRLYTGNLSEAEILQTIQEYKPEQVLFGRFKFPEVEKYLLKDYRLVRDRREMRLYIRNGL